MFITDFAAHNEEVKQIFADIESGKRPKRIPIIFGLNTRYYILGNHTNPECIIFKDYTLNPDIMLKCQLKWDDWQRNNVPMDVERGLPSKEWLVGPDFQNFFEAACLGCQVYFPDNQVPTTRPILAGDKNKYKLFGHEPPGPFEIEWGKKSLEYYEYFKDKERKGFEYKGRPIKAFQHWSLWTGSGPLTLAADIRGNEIFTDFYTDPEYVHRLLDYLAETVVARMRAWRKIMGEPEVSKTIGIADDSIQLISTGIYKEFVLPAHRKIINTLSTQEGPHSIHLCGDASRHFSTLKKELNIMSFDTGFPINFDRLRMELGDDVLISGGPTIMLLRDGTPEEIEDEAKRILSTPTAKNGRFILRDGNNVAPGTPLRNMEAMYIAGRKYGE